MKIINVLFRLVLPTALIVSTISAHASDCPETPEPRSASVCLNDANDAADWRGDTEASQEYLNWRNRPESISSAITEAFEKISNRKEWAGVYTGEEKYDILAVDEHAAAKRIIQDAFEEQEEF